MASSIAIVPTANGGRYIRQLVSHWSHKFAIVSDGDSAHVPLPLGSADISAGDMALTVRCTTAEEGNLAPLQKVIAEHLGRFAWREDGLKFTWQPG